MIDFLLREVAALPVSIMAIALSYKYLFSTVGRKYVINRLRGTVICVTGASSGIGKEIAKFCFDHGAKVVLVARRQEIMEELREQMLEGSNSDRSNEIAIVCADLGNLDEIDSYAQKILDCFGVIHGLINNAGIGCRGSVESTLLEVHQNVMNLNYFSQVALVKYLLPSMINSKEQCWIVATSSLQGKFALPFRSTYAASKHAVQAFYDSLRAEVEWRSNISVCLISPGYVQTDISLNAATGSGKSWGKMDKTIATGMTAEECARRTVEAFVSNKKDVCIAPWYHSTIQYFRVLLPSLYFYFMKKKGITDSKIFT